MVFSALQKHSVRITTMRDSRRYWKQILILLCILGALSVIPADVPAEEIRLDGTYLLSRNGDVEITVKLTTSMMLYQMLRENVSNLHLVLRELASTRADTEVVEKKADWDDSNRTMTFSMRLLGAGRNMGNHWELEIPKGTEFINLDEGKRTFYFNETGDIGSLATMRGTAKLIMPAEARQFKWEQSRRVVSYTIPAVSKAPGRNLTLLIGAIVLIVVGIALTTTSFFVKPGPQI